ncbi:MAG: efflux RND transporter periplasmic adaptor subunit, partial [Bacteroidota bacterium]
MIRLTLLSFIILAFVSCGDEHNHSHDDHHHDEVKLPITAYSKSFELFAEADPFVLGKTSEILVHISHLENFSPLATGTMTMSMVTAGKGVRQTRRQPIKAGIYHFRLQPVTTGLTRVFFDIEHEGETIRIEGGNFMVYDDEHEALHAAEKLLPDHPAPVSFTKEQAWLVDFATTEVAMEPLGLVIKAVGEVMPARGNEVILTATTQGTVNFTNNNLYEGTQVKQGDMLLQISGEGLAEGNAALRYQEARNNFEKAKADYERMKPLAEARIVSQREWIATRTNYENARALYQSLSENFTQSGQAITSPIKGHITRLMVTQGEHVEVGQPIIVLARNNGIVIKTEVQQQYSANLSKLNTANITDAQGHTYSLDSLRGKLLSYGQSTIPGSHLLPVYLSANPQQGWVTGTLLDVYL